MSLAESRCLSQRDPDGVDVFGVSTQTRGETLIRDRLLRRRTMSVKNKATDGEHTQHALLNTYGYIRWEAQGVYGRDGERCTGHA